MIIKRLILISVLCFLFNIMCSIILINLFNLHPWRVFAHYYGIGFILVYVHYLGHSKWGGLWRKQHVIHHHIRCYPYKKFLSIGPYKTLNIPIYKDGNIWMFLVPALLGCLLLSTNFMELIGMIIFSLIILIREDWLHQMIHTSPRGNNSIFETLRELHYLHHKGDMKCNYGFCDPFHDWVLGTLKF